VAKIDLNKVFLLGRLTKDPEGGITKKDKSYCNFSIANNSLKDVHYFDIAAFGKLAEISTKFLSKGKQVLIEGRLCLNKWKTPEGEFKTKINIMAENITFLGNSNQDGDFNTGRPPVETSPLDENDEEIPF
jgi:single-strand DNA-binding protein